MRAAGERLLADFPRFTSIAGTAEATTLPDHSVDFITAAQAAHWFHRGRARREFVRIQKPGGWLVLLWNERLTDSTRFLRDYEELLLTYGTDYQEIRHERTTDAINEFYDPAPFQERVFDMRQEFDYAGLEGRLLSSSYAPGPKHRSMRPCCGNCGASSTPMPSTAGLRSNTRRGCISGGSANCRSSNCRVEDLLIKSSLLPYVPLNSEVYLVSDEKSFHMTPKEFRRYGHAVVDWIADYQSRVESFPVLSQVKPGEIRASLPAIRPRKGSFRRDPRRRRKLILPGVTHWQSPNFFAYFPCNARAPILGDLVSSGLGVQGMLWSTSPACTELETQVMDWLVGISAFRKNFCRREQAAASFRTRRRAPLCAPCWRVVNAPPTTSATKRDAMETGRLRFHANAFVLEKAAMIAGIGVENLRLIEVDEKCNAARRLGAADRGRPAAPA